MLRFLSEACMRDWKEKAQPDADPDKGREYLLKKFASDAEAPLDVMTLDGKYSRGPCIFFSQHTCVIVIEESPLYLPP